MPIYEYYCSVCNTIFNFFSRTVSTDKKPQCPRCKQITLERKMSTFATFSKNKRNDEINGLNINNGKLDKAISLLAQEARQIKENDPNPKQIAHLMRKFSQITGLRLGRGIEDAIRRIEAGEDPEKVEEEMGDILGEEVPSLIEEKKEGKIKHLYNTSFVDETLYELE